MQVQTASRGPSEQTGSPEAPASREETGEKGEPAEKLTGFANDWVAFKEMMFVGLNVLLIFVPLGLASEVLGWSSAVIFSFNFLGIIPLAAILGTATEALAEHTGQTLGGLINASFGNAVEIIITISAIKRGLCRVVQAGLIGSVLSNLLLVLGMAFLASGMLRSEQAFNKDGAGANTSCLLVAATGVGIPTLFASAEIGFNPEDTLQLSRKCAIILAMVYGFFLVFQLGTHQHHFEDVAQAVSKEEMAQMEATGSGVFGNRLSFIGNEDDDEDGAVMSPGTSTFILFISTVIVAQLSELMIGSVEDFSHKYSIPKSFIGLILLPIVGNAAEHSTAVVAAFKGKMDLAIGVAVGSSTQIALLVVPFSIMVGWYFDQPMNLDFGTFYSGIFLLAVFLVGSVLHDGSSNWLEGLMLIATYVMIATICWFIPNSDAEATMAVQ